MFSYFLYIFVFVLATFMALISMRRNSFAYIFLGIIVISLVAGLRSPQVGKDTANYYLVMNQLSSNVTNSTYIYIPAVEDSFKIIVSFLLTVWNNEKFVLFVLAFISHFFIILRLWDFRKESVFPICVLLYLLVFYFLSLNIMRQICSIAFIFWGTRYLEKRKYVLYLVFLAIGFLFHTSALLGALYFLFEFFYWKHLKIREKAFLLALLIVLPLAVVYFLLTFSKYQHYFSRIEVNLGLLIIAKLILFVCIFVNRKKEYCNCLNDNISTRHHYYVFAGILLTSVGYIFPYMNRIGLYFSIFEIIIVGSLFLKTSKRKSLTLLLAIAIYGGAFLIDFVSDGNGVIPYTI